MKFGLTEDQYQFIQSVVVDPLESCGSTVWCYGSRARGDFKKFSDLDLMVESNYDLSFEIGKIQEELTESHFPYKVDLVQWMDFAESYKSGYLEDRKKF